MLFRKRVQCFDKCVTKHKIKLLILPTVEAIEVLNRNPNDTNAILHVTC